jgi:hypothetical protein
MINSNVDDDDFEIFNNNDTSTNSSSHPRLKLANNMQKQQMPNQYPQQYTENSQVHQSLPHGGMPSMPNMMPVDPNMMPNTGYMQHPQPGFMPGYNMGYPGYMPQPMPGQYHGAQSMPNNP